MNKEEVKALKDTIKRLKCQISQMEDDCHLLGSLREAGVEDWDGYASVQEAFDEWLTNG